MTKIDLTKFEELDQDVRSNLESLAKESNAYLI